MQLTWKTVDKWRERRDMPVSELARRAGIPERTVYAGVRKDARLRAATTAAVRAIFPDEYAEKQQGRVQ